jgi:hypothetical protein
LYNLFIIFKNPLTNSLIMAKEIPTNRQERLERFLKAVEKAQKLQNDFLKYGLNCVKLYVEDVDGDWLEKWGEDEATIDRETPANQSLAFTMTRVGVPVIDFISAFLASNYPAAVWARESNHSLAVRVQQQIETEGLYRIITRLEQCLSISDKYDRFRAATNILAGGAVDTEATRNSSDENDDEIKLLDLAESLLEKLAGFKEESANLLEGE